MRRLSSNEGVGTLERQSRPSISTLDDDEEDYPVEVWREFNIILSIAKFCENYFLVIAN